MSPVPFTEQWPAEQAPAGPVRAYLGIGTNLGDRAANLEQAIARLSASGGITYQSRSSAIITPPWGKTDQPDFLNAVIGIDTTLSPRDLLQRGLEIERQMGRIREEKWGPRLIDIDVLTYGHGRIEADGLSIPHPHMLDREFVMGPLREIAPHLVPDLQSALAAI
jgi:2-amino-4-hydroxy-6-hydroxymethyldihydropteridine diphosphokinase